MRLYTDAEEERVRTQARVRDWARSQLITPEQAERMRATLHTDLRRTHVMLRAVLAFFTVVVVGGVMGLLALVFNIWNEGPVAIFLGLGAAGCWVLAQYAVTQMRTYRYGVEEALAGLSVALVGVSAGLAVATANNVGWRWEVVIALGTAAIAASIVYVRIGLVYAALVAVLLAGAIPFVLRIDPRLQHTVAAAVLAVVFALARQGHRQYGDDYPGDDFAAIEAVSWLGVYGVVNLHLAGLIELSGRDHHAMGSFYWVTYGLTWILPAVGFAVGIRDRSRWVVDVNLVMALATLATNKMYLGWPRQTWDPMLLGLLLMGTAVTIRRWLAAGVDGHRAGITPASQLDSQRALMRVVSTASAGIHPPSGTPTEPQPSGFGGGRSGGAGATLVELVVSR